MDYPSTPPLPSATKVLSIHELVRLIASFNTVIDRVTPAKAFGIDRKDLVQFSQVCRQTFETLTPAIWESVNGAEHLLKLIGPASVVSDDTTGKLQNITLPDQFTNRTFERFDSYAPHVKYLSVYGKNYYAFGVQGWSTLTSRSQSHPLLPHLKSILFQRNSSPGYEHDESRWITCFATVATVDVYTAFDIWGPGPFSYAAASDLLQTVINRCPNVETLTLHPWDAHEWRVTDNSITPDNSSTNHWYQHLQFLPNLRYLSVSEGWLCSPSLQALSRLPQLKSLDIRPGDYKGFDVIDDLDPNLDLSPGAFPSLEMLSLKRNCPLTTAKILGVQGLVCRITSLYIELGREWGTEGLGEASGSGSGANLILLLRNTPNLKHFAINFHPKLAKTIYPIKFPEALEVMMELPLQTVKLPNLHWGSRALGVDFGTVWSNVTRLSMPHQYASLRELWYFATMPRLKRLTLMLDLTLTYTPVTVSHLPGAPLRALECSLGSRVIADWEIVNHNAETIARFWPDTCIVKQTGTAREDEFERWEIFMPLLNHLINTYTDLHAADTQEEREEVETILEEDEEFWNLGYGKIYEPGDVYVYGGPSLDFEYRDDGLGHTASL